MRGGNIIAFLGNSLDNPAIPVPFCRPRMRLLAIPLLLILSLSFLHAQDARPAPLERALWVTGGVVTFASFDYLVVGLFRPNHEDVYKVLQYAVQAGITYILYKKCGLSSAIGFNTIWWTYGADMVYYGICELRGVPGNVQWPGTGSWDRDTAKGSRFVGWTPVGILRGARAVETHPVPRNTVVAQSLAGAVIGLSITIAF
jgi:hypothetical protein